MFIIPLIYFILMCQSQYYILIFCSKVINSNMVIILCGQLGYFFVVFAIKICDRNCFSFRICCLFPLPTYLPTPRYDLDAGRTSLGFVRNTFYTRKLIIRHFRNWCTQFILKYQGISLVQIIALHQYSHLALQLTFESVHKLHETQHPTCWEFSSCCIPGTGIATMICNILQMLFGQCM